MKLIILFIIIIFLLLKFINFDHFIFKSVNTKQDKFVTVYNNFLSAKECNNITNLILNNKLHNKNSLSDLFNNSYGILIKFQDNKNTKNKFKDNKLLPIYEIFKRIKDPKCNAFVFNSLVIKTNTNKNSSIGVHYDNTLLLKTGILNRYILPKWISVIYLNIPNTFKGGDILVNNFRNHNFICPKAKITPKVGKYIKFRGDSNHYVKNIESLQDSYRISIIFEQYVVDNKINIPFSIN